MISPFNTPYINTIPPADEPKFPGDGELEWRIRSLVRWNAMAMVVRANRVSEGIGGHISTYASCATLFEVGFNHFFRGRKKGFDADIVYFQGHASPGIYARAYLEGRLTRDQLENFRQELRPGGGLSSYPHPWLMPHFWEVPTVSMGLGAIMAIYQARFNRYLEDRGLKPRSDSRVWAFIGDGETDEPESLGALSLAARERLDNLIFVVNCNLQRLDGPVRGNGKIIQELEAIFRGAGWNVIKVIWGGSWDPLLARDHEGLLVSRMNEVIDGQYQKYTVENGAYIRKDFFGHNPKLLDLVSDLSDEQIRRLRRGGHDPVKIYAAYHAAVNHRGQPTVILAKTIKGYGLGEAGEGRNITHQQKKLNEDELREFRIRFGIPITDEDVPKAPFFRPGVDASEIKYLLERRDQLGGFIPCREVKTFSFKAPAQGIFDEFFDGTSGREVSTTMAFVRILAKLLRDKKIGRYLVPIIPDEARTFGMDSLFRQCGIYSSVGQLYEPVDAKNLLYYREAHDGQIIEEGITEAGAMSSFIAAGTAYATHGINTIPFFMFYSMFGLQRVGDLIWAAADARAKGFLIGATSGRTTLAGEGLQHQDGHSHILAQSIPTLQAFDPAFAYEMAVIIRDSLRRMYEKREDVFYYMTVGNENYVMPPMPRGAEDGILKGMYLLRRADLKGSKRRAHILGSGALIHEALKAQIVLEGDYGVATDVWSVTSYKRLHQDACDIDRWNRLNPWHRPKIPYVARCLSRNPGVVVAVSDYLKCLPHSIGYWIGAPFAALGTDGFGRSDGRMALRAFFEVDFRHIIFSTLSLLARESKIKMSLVRKAAKILDIDSQGVNPVYR